MLGGLPVGHDVLHLLEHRVHQAVAEPQRSAALADTPAEAHRLGLQREGDSRGEVGMDGSKLRPERTADGRLDGSPLRVWLRAVTCLCALRRCHQLRHVAGRAQGLLQGTLQLPAGVYTQISCMVANHEVTGKCQ